MHIEPDHRDLLRRPFSEFQGIENELDAKGLFALAYWFDDAQHSDAALEHYQKALEADSTLAEAHYNMGIIYNHRLNRAKAAMHLKKAMQIKPDMAESYSTLAIVRFDQHRYEESLALLEQAVGLKPDLAQAHYHMGMILQETGRYQQGLNCFKRACKCDPEFSPARWRHLLSLPMIYDTAEQIDEMRQRFRRNLDRLVQSIQLDTSQQVQYALQGLQSATNFYLQYQGRNDLDPQQKYGRLVHRVMKAAYPQWSRRLPLPQRTAGAPMRIGYVSSFMHQHTIGTFLWGWVRQHDAGRFQVHCYHVGQRSDELTECFKTHSHRFQHLPGDVEATAARIVADRLHILIFSDIGMTMETLQLAGLRLAPIQCKGWGHPVTTGLPTIDYYLSSDLMEPRQAVEHYSETLIRLPNLALCYQPPKLPSAPLDIATLGIDRRRFIFLSPQSIYKYLPQYDHIYPQIAKQVPNACFVFIRHQSHTATRRFAGRLKTAFDGHDLDFNHYCRFAPRMSIDQFLALNMAAHVLLDTFDWSGGKTTLEAISCGLPVVTCPGRFMRGRHAFAMLTRMGLSQTIAKDIPSYCRIAVRLALDPQYYRTAKAGIKARRHKLYNDHVFMTALEDFYQALYPPSGSGAKDYPS